MFFFKWNNGWTGTLSHTQFLSLGIFFTDPCVDRRDNMSIGWYGQVVACLLGSHVFFVILGNSHEALCFMEPSRATWFLEQFSIVCSKLAYRNTRDAVVTIV